MDLPAAANRFRAQSSLNVLKVSHCYLSRPGSLLYADPVAKNYSTNSQILSSRREALCPNMELREQNRASFERTFLRDTLRAGQRFKTL